MAIYDWISENLDGVEECDKVTITLDYEAEP